MTEHEAIRRVRRSAELLDRKHPGWADRVPADERLRMRSCDRCLLGWLYGDYGDGLDELWDSMCAMMPHHAMPQASLGFTVGLYDLANASRAYHLLADAWRAAIRARGGGLPRPTEGNPCSS